jgi:fatty-acyl-CoA synthase
MSQSPPFRQELTPVSFLQRAATVHAERTAVVDGGRSLTWSEFGARARRFAGALVRAGLKPGERVAFLALNGEPLLLAHFAVLMAGGVLVAINTRLSAGEVDYILGDSSSHLLFYSPELSGVFSVDGGVRQVACGAELDAFIAEGAEVDQFHLADERSICAIDYTSGTTGRPKGVMYSHRGAYLNALGMVVENRLTADSVHLWTLPMFHCNGWSHTWAMAASGAKSVAIPRIDPGEVWEILARQKVTHFNAAPTVLIMLANHPAARRLEQRVRVCVGGAPPSPTLIEQMAGFNIDLVHLYGLTETFGPLTINVLPPDASSWTEPARAAYQARQGYAHVTAGGVRVVDEDMHDVPADSSTLGEVVARGNTLMQGYFGQDAATAEAFKGGWFHTGDVGVRHPDGSIELRDRKKDIVISGGENISTIEVEQALMSHPSVMEAAVVAIPDAKWGEVPKAFVALKPGASATESELIEFVRGRIAHFKAPKAIEFGELPKTSTGKIQKYVLREREWAGLARRIN